MKPQLKVFSYTSIGSPEVEGLGALVIPMFIAALIVLNAMMGAVYERFREIGIYSSVGLAPLHIALLFVAEACVYAIIGVTIGYILGQSLGKALLALDLLQGNKPQLLVYGGDCLGADRDGRGLAFDYLSGQGGGPHGRARYGSALDAASS